MDAQTNNIDILDQLSVTEKLNMETAQMPWHELQTHFARGSAVYVAADLDLLQIAQYVSEDNAEALQRYNQEQRFGLVTEALAQAWFDKNQMMWACVVAPWVLVQPIIQH